MNTAQLKKQYAEQIAPALEQQFNYTSKMQVPVLKKIVVKMGLGMLPRTRRLLMSLSTRFLPLQVRRQLPLTLARTLQTSSFVRRCLSALW